VGRGGKRGTYSGKGMKGQKSRAGRRIRPQARDMIKKLHKKRGYFFNSIQKKPQVVNLEDLEKKFSAQDGKDVVHITPKLLVELGLVRAKGNKIPKIKILGKGKLRTKLSFDESVLISNSAKAKIK